MFWVYILRCADGSYYTGHTDNLEKRIGQYQTGMRGLYRNAPSGRAYLVAGVCHAGRSLVGRDANKGLEPQEERSHDARRLDGSFLLGEK
jgi:hypothetical protein